LASPKEHWRPKAPASGTHPPFVVDEALGFVPDPVILGHGRPSTPFHEAHRETDPDLDCAKLLAQAGRLRHLSGFSVDSASVPHTNGLLGFSPGGVEPHHAFGGFGEAVPALDADRRARHAGPVRPGKFSKLFTRPWKLGLGGGRFLR
jgi:hypothetical protein